MTRGELRAQTATTSHTLIWRALCILDDLWTFRCAAAHPDCVPELDEFWRGRLLRVRDRADEILNADRNAREGKRAA